MPGVDDQAAVARWLYSRLTGDAGVAALVAARVYPEHAPQDESGSPDTEYPFVYFSFNSSTSMRVSGGRARALSDQFVVVGATVEGEDYDTAVVVMQAVDGTLTADDAEGSIDVGGVLHYVSVVGVKSSFRLPEFVRGQHYRTSGRVYWVQVYDR